MVATALDAWPTDWGKSFTANSGLAEKMLPLLSFAGRNSPQNGSENQSEF
jgi:hypothetical protein